MKKSTSVKKKATNVATPVVPATVPSQEKNPGNEALIPFPSAKEHTLTSEAHDLWYKDINTYTNAKGQTSRETRRHYLPLPAVEDIVQALGRQMTVEDMNLLVGLDGDSKVTCAMTKREFQPVWWVLITPNLLYAIARERAINEEMLQIVHAIRVGQFFPDPDEKSNENYPVCGVPYFWKKNVANDFAIWSPLWDMKKINRGRFGETHSTIEKILKQRTAIRHEEEIAKQGLMSLREKFQAAEARGNRGPDRRQWFKPKDQK